VLAGRRGEKRRRRRRRSLYAKYETPRSETAENFFPSRVRE